MNAPVVLSLDKTVRLTIRHFISLETQRIDDFKTFMERLDYVSTPRLTTPPSKRVIEHSIEHVRNWRQGNTRLARPTPIPLTLQRRTMKVNHREREE